MIPGFATTFTCTLDDTLQQARGILVHAEEALYSAVMRSGQVDRKATSSQVQLDNWEISIRSLSHGGEPWSMHVLTVYCSQNRTKHSVHRGSIQRIKECDCCTPTPRNSAIWNRIGNESRPISYSRVPIYVSSPFGVLHTVVSEQFHSSVSQQIQLRSTDHPKPRVHNGQLHNHNLINFGIFRADCIVQKPPSWFGHTWME